MSLPLGTQLGNYKIINPIGAGGMGEVYRAHDHRLGRDVAIKVLPDGFGGDKDRLQRFEAEARALAALDHPNILAVYDVGEHDGAPFLVMQLLEGETLRERLAAGALQVKDAVLLAIQMARGLAIAHAKGLIHRDLKPANLFITNDGHLKILDFGLAKQTALAELGDEDATRGVSSLTALGMVVGTVGYMAPEQISGQAVDARSDIFAFGVVFFEMLSGTRAFERGSLIETLSATLKEDPPPLRSPMGSIPLKLQQFVGRCLAKEPARRFPNLPSLLAELEALQLDASGPTVGPVGEGRPRRSVPFRTWLAAGGGVLAVAAGLGFWLGRTPHSPALSLVALPCQVLGAPDSAYLADAFPNTLSTLLGEVPGMHTKIPPSSFEVEAAKGNLDRIARVYGVDLFLLSTVTAEGDHLVFNIQLADARTRQVRWSHSYQGSRAGYTALAREASQGICVALRPEQVLPSAIRASDSRYELAFQQGKYYANRYLNHEDRTDFDRSLAAFDEALAADPRSAHAAAWTAYLYACATLGLGQIAPGQGLREAKAWVQKALALDPGCSEAWVVLSFMESFKPDADLAKQILWSLKGAQLDPGSPDAQQYFAMGLATGGSMELSSAALREELKLAPLNVNGYEFLALFLTRSGRAQEALPVLDTLLSLDPGNPWAHAFKAQALLELGRTGEAAELLKAHQADWPAKGFLADRVQDARWLLAMAAGKEQEARAALDAVMARFADRATDWNALQDNIMDLLPMVHRRFGTGVALELLERATNRGATMPYDMLMLRPDLKPLRTEPRARELIRKTKVPFELLMGILRDARTPSPLPPYLVKPMEDLLGRLRDEGAWNGGLEREGSNK